MLIIGTINKVKTIYVICGPTAVGKSAVAMELATRLGTAIVSADSRQCYKVMDIGTAKPTVEDRTNIQHYFVAEYPVTQNISAADYETLALGYLDTIFKHHDSAVVCGGTGLYIKALCEGLDAMPAIDVAINKEVNAQYKEQGIAWLQNEMGQHDPAFYASGEIQNPMRMIRALVFKLSTGDSIVNYRTGVRKERPFNIVKVGIELPREQLYSRINARVDSMMEHGLLEEVKSLYAYKALKNLQTVGYTELFDHLDSLCTLEDAVQKIKQNTRHYAKRQMTWFKKDKEVVWMDGNDNDIIERILALK
jgi:tRNA dimethylallyltransferase